MKNYDKIGEYENNNKDGKLIENVTEQKLSETTTQWAG